MKGSVIYLAGENPTDVQMRWFGQTRDLKIDTGRTNVHLVNGVKRLSEVGPAIAAEVARKNLQPALVVIDTSATFFEGEDENSNAQVGLHARRLRWLTTLPGGPCVIVLCHPTKNATDETLLPRGGGAFIAEVDGNVALRKLDRLVAANALGKFRGPEFAPLHIELHVVRDHPRLVDKRGRNIPTVIARPVDAASTARMENAGREDDNAVLQAVDRTPSATPTDIARVLDWKLRAVGGKEAAPNHVKAKRALDRLKKEKLVDETLGRWRTTPKGQKHLNFIETAERPSSR